MTDSTILGLGTAASFRPMHAMLCYDGMRRKEGGREEKNKAEIAIRLIQNGPKRALTLLRAFSHRMVIDQPS